MIKRFLALVLTCSFFLIFGALPSHAASPNRDERRISAALDQAFGGKYEALENLLKGELANKTQQALRSRLEARGDFDIPPDLDASGPVLPSRSGPVTLSTGTYDDYCTGYNGVTMGWFGKEILACHGWLDSYISGNHVAHYNPDLIPRGAPISIGCFASAVGLATSLFIPGSGSVIGWARYGIGVLASGYGIVVSCP